MDSPITSSYEEPLLSLHAQKPRAARPSLGSSHTRWTTAGDENENQKGFIQDKPQNKSNESRYSTSVNRLFLLTTVLSQRSQQPSLQAKTLSSQLLSDFLSERAVKHKSCVQITSLLPTPFVGSRLDYL